MATQTASSPSYSATKDQLLDRLKEIEGQVRGVEGMVADDRYCIDVLMQISAVKAALEDFALGLVNGHAAHCVAGAEGEIAAEKADELMAAIGRLMRNR